MGRQTFSRKHKLEAAKLEREVGGSFVGGMLGMDAIGSWYRQHTEADDHITRANKLVILFVALISGIGLLGNYLLFVFRHDTVAWYDHIVLFFAPMCVVVVTPKHCIESTNIEFTANMVFAASYLVVLANTLHTGSATGTVMYFMLALAICYALLFGWAGFVIAAIVSVCHFLFFLSLGESLQSEFSLAHRFYRFEPASDTVGAIKSFAIVYLTAASCAAAFHTQMSGVVRDLAQARRIADEANRAKSDLLAVTSHEIRTPLNGVVGMLELAQHGALPPDQRHRIELAHKASRELVAILDDLLDLAKIEAGRLRLAEEPVSPRDIVSETVLLFAPKAAAKGLELDWSVTERTPEWVFGDPKRLRQIIWNLVSNAIKFTSSGSVKVELDCQVDPALGALHVSVRDTGVGLSESQISKLFQPFQQVRSRWSEDQGGTGLGLAVCKQLVEAMGGRIGVQSGQARGSTFWFTLPAQAASSPLLLDENDLRLVRSLERDRTLRILVVDDHPVNQEVLREILSSLGHQVEIAKDGLAAITCAEGTAYDLILMDVRMPGMDGRATTLNIRSSAGPNQRTPIIAVTGDDEPLDRELSLAAGMSGFVRKPIAIAELLDQIEELTG